MSKSVTCSHGPELECRQCRSYCGEVAPDGVNRCCETRGHLTDHYDGDRIRWPVKETLPDNNPKTQYGVKKPSLALVPAASLIHEATAFMDGAAKYGPYNWRENKVSAMVYLNAADRHMRQFLDGEDFDPISGVHHLGHAKACFGIILDAMETGNLVDDRPNKGKAGELIRRFMELGTLELKDAGNQ